MTFDEYQKIAKTTDLAHGKRDWNDPHVFEQLLGLGGESGEVMEKFKKILRDKDGRISPEDAKDLAKELGDILWYIAVISDKLGVDLETVARLNVKKITGRLKRKMLHGSGDDREEN